MNILETFYILFESDTSAVKKGTQDAKKSTDELNRSLKQTDDASKKVGNEFVRMLSGAAGAIAAGLSVAAITSSVMAAANYADALGDVSNALDINIEDLSAYADAVQLSGGSNEAFIGTVKSMTASLADFATKGSSRAAPFFEELGIKMVDASGKARDFMEILPELADKFEGMSKQESFGIGQKMGLDQGTIMLLQSGRREMDALIARQRELGVVNKEAAEVAAKFNDQMDDTSHVFRSLFQAVATTVLPVFTAVMAGVEKMGMFFSKHSDFIVGLMIALGSAVAFYVVPALITAGVAAVAAFAPFLMMGAAIAAVSLGFALLYDDVMNFIDGNDSLIGQIATEYPLLTEIVKALAGVVRFAWDLMAGMLQFLVELFTAPEVAFENLVNNIGQGLVTLEGLFPSLFATIGQLGEVMVAAGEVVVGVWDSIINTVSVAIEYLMGAIDKVINAFGKVKSFLGFGSDETQASITAGQQTLAMVGSTPLASMSSNAITNSSMSSNRSTSVQVGTVNVQTQATDADGIAGAIGNSMSDQMRQATQNFDDGVLA